MNALLISFGVAVVVLFTALAMRFNNRYELKRDMRARQTNLTISGEIAKQRLAEPDYIKVKTCTPATEQELRYLQAMSGFRKQPNGTDMFSAKSIDAILEARKNIEIEAKKDAEKTKGKKKKA